MLICACASDGATIKHSTPGYRTQNKKAAIFDISEYNNKYLNIQFSAEVGQKAKLYLNGNLVSEWNAGTISNYGYDYCTLGDLRPARGLKYAGTIYNAALYGEVLTDEEAVQNWNYIKNELGINEAGEKVSN